MSAFRFPALYFATAFALWAFNHWFGFPVQFLRAESGWFLQEAFSPNAWSWIGPCFTHTYSGHYLPAAFSIELLASRLIGPSELLWSIRQAAVLAAMSVATAYAIKSVMLKINPAANRTVALSIGILLAASFAVHPFAVELFSWPFMWLQMACLGCMALSMYWMMEFIDAPSRRTALWCTLSAYVSMHFLAVGLAISVAALTTMLLIAYAQGVLSKARSALLIGMALTAVHAIPSAIDGGGRSGPLQLSASIRRFLTLLTEQPIAALRASLSTPWLIAPDFQYTVTQTAIALAAIGVVTFLIIRLWLSAANNGDSRKIALAAAVAFPLIAFLGTCFMTAARLRAETDSTSLIPFIIGGRYLIFPMFYGLLMLSAAISASKISQAICFVAAVTFAISSALFVRDVAPHLWPDRILSNQEAWDRAKANPESEADLTRYAEFWGKQIPICK